MTPDERDRLTRAEAQITVQAEAIAGMDEKLDRLLDFANMGKGAWGFILRLGGFLLGIAAIGTAASSILGWHR